MKQQKQNVKYTALYCRLSRDDGTMNESMSIETQKSMLAGYAKEKGFKNAKFYVDDGYSGTNFDRPAFKEMVEDIEEGVVETVITKDLSRLGRNYLETGTYIEIFFPRHDVRFIAVNDGVDSNDREKMDITPFHNIINSFYAKDASRKIKSAIRARRNSGKYMATTAPYGYIKDPDDHNHLLVDEEHAKIVRRIFDMVLEGSGLYQIARRLKAEKIPRPSSLKAAGYERYSNEETMYEWDSSYLSSLLHNPVYAGHIAMPVRPCRSMHSNERDYVPASEREIIRNTHEAIVDQRVFDEVGRLLSSRFSSFKCPASGYENVFKGVLVCPDCGSVLQAKIEKRRRRSDIIDQTYYCCGRYRKFGSGACSAHIIEARVIRDNVRIQINRYIRRVHEDRDELKALLERRFKLNSLGNRKRLKNKLEGIKKRIGEIGEFYATLYENFTRGIISEERFRTLSVRYDDEEKELRTRIEELKGKERAEKDDREKIERFLEMMSNAEELKELTYNNIHELVDKIKVYEADGEDPERGRKIDICFKYIGRIDSFRIEE